MVTALTMREVEAEVVKDDQVLLRDAGVPHPCLTNVALALAREAEPVLLPCQLRSLMVTALTMREVEAEVVKDDQVLLRDAGVPSSIGCWCSSLVIAHYGSQIASNSAGVDQY